MNLQEFKRLADKDFPCEREKRERDASRLELTHYSCLDGDLMTTIPRADIHLDLPDTEESSHLIDIISPFLGSGGHAYNTWPDGCSCPDFILRHLPCQHMYLLAHITAGYPLPVAEAPDEEQVQNCIACIQAYGPRIQDLIYELLVRNTRGLSLVTENGAILKPAIRDGLVETFEDRWALFRSFGKKEILHMMDESDLSLAHKLKSRTVQKRYEWCEKHYEQICTEILGGYQLFRATDPLAQVATKVLPWLEHRRAGTAVT